MTTKGVNSFLQCHTQKVRIDGCTSDTLPVISGVPPRFSIEPFLNDLPNSVKSKVRLFPMTLRSALSSNTVPPSGIPGKKHFHKKLKVFNGQRATTQVMRALSLRARWDATLVSIITQYSSRHDTECIWAILAETAMVIISIKKIMSSTGAGSVMVRMVKF